MTPTLLSVRDLTVVLRAKDRIIRAVDGVSFDIAPGQTLAIVGESGSGKSMTAMSVVGLAPSGTEMQVSGRAVFDGHDLLTLGRAGLRTIRARRIRSVFQDPAAALNPMMTIGRQIAESLRAAGKSSGRAHIASLMAEVGLDRVPDMPRRYAHELSGGQQQRAMIAMALAGDPELLIADEPTTALDMTVQAQVLDLLRGIQTARGMAILMISHDLGVVANLAHDVVILKAGRILEHGPARQVLREPRHAYTQALIACTPQVGQRRARLQTIDMVRRGEVPGPRIPRSPAAPLLTVRSLTVRYPGRGLLAPAITALDQVDLDVPRGGVTGIVGESGSGKSTLAKALVGLVPSETGTIGFDGRVLQDPRRLGRRLRRRMQYVFQDAYGALNPRMTIRQALSEPMDIHNLEPGQARPDVIARLMYEVGLPPGLIDRYPHELSGGQRQRVTIARALALEPELLICDEVVSALDVSVQAQVLNLLADLQQARDLTLLFISHDLAVVSHFCDTVAVMDKGRVVECGPVERVFANPASPITEALLKSARALEPTLKEPPASVCSAVPLRVPSRPRQRLPCLPGTARHTA